MSNYSKRPMDRPTDRSSEARRAGDRAVNLGRSERRPGPYGPRFLTGVLTSAPYDDESIQARVAKYAALIGVLALTTLALWPIRESIGLLNIGLVYLLVVIATTFLAGRWAGIVASVLGFILFDFFLVPPYLAFAISDLQNILALVVFLAVSVLISWLLAGAREQALQAQRRADDVARLYELSQAIIGAQPREDILPSISRMVAQMLDAGVCWILLPNAQSQLAIRAQSSEDARRPTRDEMALASWAFWHGTDIGSRGDSDRLFAGSASRKARTARTATLFAPLRVGPRTIGVIGVADKMNGQPFTSAERTILSTLADQAAVALDRWDLLREAERAEVLARSDELKSALMSAVSHDLRTPLASIMALVTGLMDTDVQWDEKTQREFLRGIYDEAVRLNRIVGNMLDISRIEGGALRPEKDWYDIGEVVEGVVERLESRLSEQPGARKVTVKVDEDMPLALFDFTEIDQVLTNLVENAVRYTPPGTPIVVSASRMGDNIEVTVEDSGPGVAPEHLPYLFDKFYRVDRKRGEGGQGERGGKGAKGGIGLGLAIAKGLVEAHGGRIRATNRLEGGLRVTFTIPINGTEQAAPTATPPAAEAALAGA